MVTGSLAPVDTVDLVVVVGLVVVDWSVLWVLQVGRVFQDG